MKNTIKIYLITLLCLLFAVTVQAEEDPAAPTAPPSAGPFQPGLTEQFDKNLGLVAAGPGFETNISADSAGVFANLIAYVFSLVGIIFLILVIWSGLQWMSASGNEDKIGEAKKRITRAAIGLAITLSAFIISYTVYTFLFERYLDTAGTEIGAPPDSQTPIACENSVPDCADRGTRIFCLNNNCVECISDQDCNNGQQMGIIPVSATYCHPQWNVCMLPQNTQCSDIGDTGLCLARNDCKWIVIGSGGGGTWATGQCVGEDDPGYDCPQCNENTPVCARFAGQNPQCFECVNGEGGSPNIPGACGSLQWCSWDHTCFP